MQFKVGDKVKVIRRSISGEVYWNTYMDKAIGKTYTVLGISRNGNLRLNTESDTHHNFLYPPEGVSKKIKNQQLLFKFME